MRPEDPCYESPNFGTTGRRGAAVPVEVGPARGKPDQPGRAGKGGGPEKVDGGESTVEAVEVPTRWVVARRRLPLAMAAAPKPPKVVPQRGGATGVARKAI